MKPGRYYWPQHPNYNCEHMKVIFSLLLTIFALYAGAQSISLKLLDSLSGKPLPYATVIYHHQTKVTYTDSSGSFRLSKDSLPAGDSIQIEFLGYTRKKISASQLINNQVIRLSLEGNILAPVSVQNCRSYKQYTINKRVGKIKEYVGPGPETKFMIIARYPNNKKEEGFISRIEIWMNNSATGVKVPVRLHWYEWNNLTGTPGKELTDTNVIVYAYKEGWNSFDFPAGHCYFPLEEVVFGLEFIYPVEQMEMFSHLQSADEKINWLQNMNNRWGLGLQSVDNVAESAFFVMNNSNLAKYSTPNQRRLYRPAIRFIVNTCRN